jgi:intracellular sulfur oxidation DsrE/DsrF family protein
MKNSIEAYADPNGFAAGPNALHAVAVLYGGPSPVIALDDAMWAKYPIGKGIRANANPPVVSTPADPAPQANPAREDLADLAARHGAHFFVCNNALSGIAALLAKDPDAKAPDPSRARVVAVHEDLVAHLLPGSVLVPAGVAALNAAQEARFTLIPANA